MNKRKTTSIALATAVAISTVQLAYPANVFANEKGKESNILRTDNNITEITSEKVKKIKSDIESIPNVSTISNINEELKNKLEEIYNGISGLNDTEKKELALVDRTKLAEIDKKFFFEISDNLKKFGDINLIANEDGTLSYKIGNGEKYRPLKTILYKDGEVVSEFEGGKNGSKVSACGEKRLLTASVYYIDNAKGEVHFFANEFGYTGKDSYNQEWTNEKIDTAIFENGTEVIGAGLFGKSWGDPWTSIQGIKYIKFNEGIEEIGNDLFRTYKQGLDKESIVQLPNSLLKIGDRSFNKNIGNYLLKKNIESIGKSAFSEQRDGSVIFIENDSLNDKLISSGNNANYSPLQTAIVNLKDGELSENSKIKNSVLPIPTKEEYIFEGWYDSNGTKSENMTIEKEEKNYKSYYAEWKELNDITLVYDGDKDSDDSTSVSTNIDLGIATSIRAKDSTVAKVEGRTITAVGVGETTIEYLNGDDVIATQNVIVKAPKGTVAMVDKIPYKNLQDAVNSENNTDIKVVADVVLDTTLDLSKMRTRTIDFGDHEIKTSDKFPKNETSLIKIEGNNKKITISNAKFDTSSKEGLDAIKVVGNENGTPSVTVDKVEVNNKGNNTGSAIYVENANLEITGNVNVTGNENNKTAVEIQGDNSKVTLDKNVSINNDLTPEVGNDHSDAIIMGNETDSNDFVNENNSSSGGGGNYIPSKPTYTHEKIEGLDRYETAAKIADKLGSYDNVVLVNAESSMSDGLSASGLAGKENGAILLTKKDSIPKATMDRLKKVKKVYIIGGENAISQKVSDEITKNVPNVKIERLGGKTRIETSEIVAKKLGNYNKAFVVNGFKGEADAMSASSVAAKNGAPILLTNGKTSTHAKKAGVEYYVIGGDTVVDKSIATKYDAEVLAGKDRYATNKEVINEFYSGRDKIYFANGETLVDALTASTLAKKDGIALVNAKSDKSVLKGKDTVQVGGMKFTIDFDK